MYVLFNNISAHDDKHGEKKWQIPRILAKCFSVDVFVLNVLLVTGR